MKNIKLKNGLISNFFGGRKSQKSSFSSSPHLREPEVDVEGEPEIEVGVSLVNNQVPHIHETTTTTEESPFISSQNTTQNERRSRGPTINANGECIYDIDLLPHDPGKRLSISSYPFNEQDAVRRGFIVKGACQPRNHSFPRKNYGSVDKPNMRSFQVYWYDQYNWLEYSVEKNAAFCFVCYLFNDSAVEGFNHGFKAWNRAIERFDKHVGPNVDSAHKKALQKYENFTNPRSSIIENFSKTSRESSILYKARLTYSLDCVRFLLRQGLAFRGHDESETSSNKGNFLELLQWLARKDENINKVVLKNAPGNSKMTSSEVQKDLIHACAKSTTKLILEELGNKNFAILADESSDISCNELLAICLRFVDKKGRICERFLGLAKVVDTCSLSLKEAIKNMMMDSSLSMSRIRGQGYDGASNMRGHIGGLRTLILNDNPSAYYVHCFAHQLQLTLVAVARDNYDCKWFFEQVGYLVNLMGVSCKRKEMLRVVQAQKIIEGLELEEIQSGQGLNQELGLARPGDTRWSSHYKSILHIIALYPSIFEVLLMIGKNGHSEDRLKAQSIMLCFESFQFVFMARLMLVILGYTDDLCQALQKKDQDIVNAMTLVRLTKERLQKVRDDGWNDFLGGVVLFCAKNDIEVPLMEENYVPPGRSKRYFEQVTNLHRFRVEIFLSIIDMQLQELNNRFDEVNMELLICMASFNPIDCFAAFNKQKLLRLAEFYPNDFSCTDLIKLEFQLDHFIDDMRRDERFENVRDLGELSMKLVATNKHHSYQLVYLLLRQVLILPVATASVERVFSAMTYVKNKLRNSMADQFLNDSLVTFIERDFFFKVTNDSVMDYFQAAKSRRNLLPPRAI